MFCRSIHLTYGSGDSACRNVFARWQVNSAIPERSRRFYTSFILDIYPLQHFTPSNNHISLVTAPTVEL
jgi:hypothetical protein